MSRWSDRGQVEPLAALVAVFAVCAALSTYAGVLDGAVPTPDRNVASPTVDRVERRIADAGVVDPDRIADGLRAGPDGYGLNLTLRAAGETWSAGPTPPPSADAAAATVSVRIGSGRVRPGRLRAEVWR
ncbi:DUF7285 family protein [Halorussus marinus]|uniref:DUF7285 family protein n=1 Tax=Halorussus marinus TaxID=2505976 RepID=UPI00106EB2AE|nr:hypothetical protein [Halorussus marinus]